MAALLRPPWMPKPRFQIPPSAPGPSFHNLHAQTGGWGPFPAAYHGAGRLLHGRLPSFQQAIAMASLIPGKGPGGGKTLIGPSNPTMPARMVAPPPRPPSNPHLVALQQRKALLLQLLRSGYHRA